ncbi:unnamed protein product [Moneuplotes crassus]|uniref:non-specific serine/threonine protein kinase n=1 Tax=Euplotes crassus TaxID=5936 RepID=A0AAD1UHR4_EUPCR|nr:unnamed protein product [Moneuplotes crassus]
METISSINTMRDSIRDSMKKVKKLCETKTCRVYLYKDLKTSEQVVIKKMKVENPGCVQEKTDMKNECILLSKCNHPNIIKYHGAKFFSKKKKSRGNRSDNLPRRITEELWIKMEYAPEGSLANLIKKNKNIDGEPKYLSEKMIYSIFLQICKGIKHIHDKKIIHRDIKPDNIFMFKDGLIKIGDFGVSKIINESIQLNTTLAGSPYYIAPEVFMRKYNSKADIWSMGVTMYELCTFTVPFKGRNAEGLKKNIFHQKQVDPLPDCYSVELNKLILMLLKRNIINRITIDEIIDKIVELEPSLSEEVKDDLQNNKSKVDIFSDWDKKEDNYFNCTVKTDDTVQQIPENMICVEDDMEDRKKHRINKFLESQNQNLNSSDSKINLSFNFQISLNELANCSSTPSLQLVCEVDKTDLQNCIKSPHQPHQKPNCKVLVNSTS